MDGPRHPIPAEDSRDMRLKDKTALITAAGQGIGYATALRFAPESARVIANAIHTAKHQAKEGRESIETRRPQHPTIRRSTPQPTRGRRWQFPSTVPASWPSARC